MTSDIRDMSSAELYREIEVLRRDGWRALAAGITRSSRNFRVGAVELIDDDDEIVIKVHGVHVKLKVRS
jgi:hypothetical protein